MKWLRAKNSALAALGFKAYEDLLSTGGVLLVSQTGVAVAPAQPAGSLYSEAFNVASLVIPQARRVYAIDYAPTNAVTAYAMFSDAAALPADGVTPKGLLGSGLIATNALVGYAAPQNRWTDCGGVPLANGLAVYLSSTNLTKTLAATTFNVRVWFST